MIRDFARPTAYRAAINLYVEDRTTLVYLRELWNDPLITYYLGGGNEGVATIVRVDREAGHPNVFGVVDRDYGESNQHKWDRPNTRLFRLRQHEVENFLLDASALASSRSQNLKLSVDQIEELLVEAARKRCWYEACRLVLRTIRGRFHEDFITDPPQDLLDIDAAKHHLCGSIWFSRLADHAARTTEDDVADLLTTAYGLTTTQLADGTWRQEFSGKNIFEDVASRICDRQKLGGIKSAELYDDLAQDVAKWQVESGQVPPELQSLRSALRVRVGLN